MLNLTTNIDISKYAVDLYGTISDISDVIFRNKPTIVCDTMSYPGNTVDSSSLHRKFVQLLREVNKDLFYKQLHHMVSLGKFTGKETISIEGLSTEIDVLVKRPEAIAQKLYTPGTFGIETYKLYQKNKKFDLSVPAERDKMTKINSQFRRCIFFCYHN